MAFALLPGCSSGPERLDEPWINKPIESWPDFALVNKAVFADTVYNSLGNAFLINTGTDTLGVTCKHIFLAFQRNQGYTSIELGEDFKLWQMYPKNNTAKTVQTAGLINSNPEEPIGEFRILKNRDWLLFDVEEVPDMLYPLKIRYTPVRENEEVYAVGWGALQQDLEHPVKIGYKNFRAVGNYYYMKMQPTEAKPNGRSGSPVIDSQGYLVGLTSGAEGRLTGTIENTGEEAVDGTVVSLADEFPDARLSASTPAGGEAVASATAWLDRALKELVRNAVVHHDRDPTVDVAVESSPEAVRVRIADDGPGMTDMNRDVLETGRAVDALYHGSGLGLWLVYWVLQQSGGSATVEDADPRGTAVTVSLARSTE